MNQENKDLTRRRFLTTASIAAVGSSIIAIEANAAPESGNTAAKLLNPAVLPSCTFVDITGKRIQSHQNIMGTDSVNVREWCITGTDITSALNSAISYLNGTTSGGQILIPHGVWTTDGGHDINHTITIEGVGFNVNTGLGSELKLNSNGASFMFRLLANNAFNCSIKNLMINLVNKPSATGILMTNHNGITTTGTRIYFTHIANVGFNHGAYGIKVDSYSGTAFECILNHFENLSFIGCRTAFYCNSINGGYKFDNCYFALPTSDGTYSTGGTALDCVSIGNLALEHCLFVGFQTNQANVPASDGSIILKTTNSYNNISFYDCQDENVEFMYKNSTIPYDYSPVVFRNCLIQSKLEYTAAGVVIFDSCLIGDHGNGVVWDHEDGSSTSVPVRVFLKGINNCYTSQSLTGGSVSNFINSYSRVIYEAKEVGLPVISEPGMPSSQYYSINATRGTVNIGKDYGAITVYNNLVNSDSLVFTQLRTYDSGGARIREVICSTDAFVIYLNQAAATDLSIAFKVEI